MRSNTLLSVLALVALPAVGFGLVYTPAVGVGGDPEVQFDAFGNRDTGISFEVGPLTIWPDPNAGHWVKIFTINLLQTGGLHPGDTIFLKEDLRLATPPGLPPGFVTDWHERIDCNADFAWGLGPAGELPGALAFGPTGEAEARMVMGSDVKVIDFFFDPPIFTGPNDGGRLVIEKYLVYTGQTILPADGTLTFTITQYPTVPEPTTVVYILFGVVSLFWLVRRRPA